MYRNFSYYLEKGELPFVIKHTYVVPVHKKNLSTNLTKIYEKLMFQQLRDHLILFFHQSNVGFVKVKVPSIGT